jgi:DNA primase
VNASLTTSDIDAVLRAFVPRLDAFEQTGDELRGPCPIHDGARESFSINVATGAWFCFSECNRGGGLADLVSLLSNCSLSDALAEIDKILGRSPKANAERRIVAEYSYQDESGNTLYQCLRYEPKGFFQRAPDGLGGWKKGKGAMTGVRLVPYRLPKVLAADEVFVFEGEKDVETAERFGFVGTCNPMGAEKWRPEFNEHFRGKRVVVVPDQDEPGRRHAAQVVRNLFGVAREVRVVNL